MGDKMIVQEIYTECYNTIALHYAKQIKKNNINASQEEIIYAIQQNWTAINNQINNLYNLTVKSLQN